MKKSKILALLGVMVMTAAAFTACGSKEEEKAEPTAEPVATVESTATVESVATVDSAVVTDDSMMDIVEPEMETYENDLYSISYNPNLVECNYDSDSDEIVILTYTGECAGSDFICITDLGETTFEDALETLSAYDLTEAAEFDFNGYEAVSCSTVTDESDENVSVSGLSVYSEFIIVKNDAGRVLLFECFFTHEPVEEDEYAISDTLAACVQSFSFK